MERTNVCVVIVAALDASDFTKAVDNACEKIGAGSIRSIQYMPLMTTKNIPYYTAMIEHNFTTD